MIADIFINWVVPLLATVAAGIFALLAFDECRQRSFMRRNGHDNN